MEVVEKEGSIILAVRVVPRASRSEIIGEHDGALKVRISSAPVDGAAKCGIDTPFRQTFRRRQERCQHPIW